MVDVKISGLPRAQAIHDDTQLEVVTPDGESPSGNGNSEAAWASQIKDYIWSVLFDSDVTLAANSNQKTATQAAVKAYADALIAANDAMVFKGVIDCSANPNYPAADRGHTYKVSVAGKIGGASGINVEVGDLLLCITDSTSSGNQATVGSAWSIIQTNLDGAVIGPSSVTSGNPAVFSGTSGKLVAEVTFSAFKTSLVLVKGDVGLGNVSNVDQIPLSYLDTDNTFAADSDVKVASQKAVKAYLLATENLPLTGGATVTSKSLGTLTSGTLTLDVGDRPLQHYTNGGAHTLAPGTTVGATLVDITNNGSAGAITTSGFTKVAGDAFTTTNGHKFRCHVSVGDGGSLLSVQALQ